MELAVKIIVFVCMFVMFMVLLGHTLAGSYDDTKLKLNIRELNQRSNKIGIIIALIDLIIVVGMVAYFYSKHGN